MRLWRADQELKFLDEPSSVFVDAESDGLASFRCSASPKAAETMWLHGGQLLLEGSPGVLKLSRHRLQVRVAANASSGPHQPSHSYQCAAQVRELLMLSNPATAIVAGGPTRVRPLRAALLGAGATEHSGAGFLVNVGVSSGHFLWFRHNLKLSSSF